jgi:hypothetical protein
MAQPGRVSRPLVPFQRLKLLNSSLKVSVAVADRLFGSIATFGSPSMAFAYQGRVFRYVD